MTNEQAIEKLSAIYGAIDSPKDGVFAAKVGNNFEMFRLEDGVLEHRVDVDYHTCVWEAVE